MHAFWSGVVAGYGIAVPVGAVGAYLVVLAGRAGLRVAVPAALGVASADVLYALLAVVGGAALATPLAAVSGPLRWASFVVLLALAVRIAVLGVRGHRTDDRADDRAEPARGQGAGVGYLTMLGATLLNPATVVYFTALVVGGGGRVGPEPGAGSLFVAGAGLASGSWQLLLVLGGSALGRIVTGRRGRLVMALVSAVLIGGLAVGSVAGS